MKIFGYGSLLCEDSFKKTVSKYALLGPATLPNYKRVFCVESPGRKNEKTRTPASVLNIEKDDCCKIMGILYDIHENELDNLHLREKGYDLKEIVLLDGTKANTYIHPSKTCYQFITGDPVQQEYLNICLEATKRLGEEFYDNFIDTTFIGAQSVREWLQK